MEIQLTTSSRSARGGRVIASLVLVIFAVVGLGFLAVLVADTAAELAIHRWPRVPCRIESSRVVDSGSDDSPYRLEVRYRYVVDGVEHTGDAVTRTTITSSSYDRLRDRALALPPGTDSFCRVDPDRPGEAVLEAQLPWALLAIPLPLIFVAVGVLGLRFVWLRRPERQQPLTAVATTGRRAAIWVPIALGAVFTVVGAAMLVFLGILPVTRTLRAAAWQPTPCTVISSRVLSHDSDDGTTYSIDIQYEYRVAGRAWRSNSFDFVPGSSSGYDAKRAIVDRYPAGAAATCYVDSEHPGRSVLERDFGLRHLLALVPLAFLLPGLGILIWGLRRRRHPPISSVSESTSETPVPGSFHPTEPPPIGPTELTPRYSPLVKIGCALGVATFWNGIVSVFAYQVVDGWLRGDPDWFLTLFLTPFVLIGLALVGSIGYFLLAAFNPRPTLTVSEGAPRLGDRLEVGWRLAGSVGRLRRLRITLEGREEATYRRGTDTHTDQRTFARGVVLDTEHTIGMRQGSGSIDLPADLVPTFEGGSNKIMWCLKVAGEIARWPDVADEFPLVVRPPRYETNR